MKYNYVDDIKFVSSFLNISLEDLGKEIGIPKANFSRLLNSKGEPSNEMLEKIYSYFYKEGIHLNELKSKLYEERYDLVLYHGSKDVIIGDISLDYSREYVDFGVGFYMGDNYFQSLDFISQTHKGNVYILTADYNDLIVKQLNISLEWMIYIAIHRGLLNEYKDTKLYKKIIDEMSSVDVIIAPIADNRMFMTIEDFVRSSITTEQAIHSLIDLSLGNQIVFKSEKAIKHIKILEKLYTCKDEKKDAVKRKISKLNDTNSFIENNYKKYIRQGLYISEVFSDERND